MATFLGEVGLEVVDLDPELARLRARKDPGEIELIRAAASVVATGVRASVDACRAGRTELDVDGAGTAAVLAVASDLGRPVTVEQLVMTPSGAEHSILPHAFSTTRRLELGDGLIHTRQVALAGYRAELERTVFVGEPSAEQRRLSEVIGAAQAAAIDAIRPGVRCSDVDAAAREVIADAGHAVHSIHRTGHGIGLAPHEPPYLRFDSGTSLRRGWWSRSSPASTSPVSAAFATPIPP